MKTEDLKKIIDTLLHQNLMVVNVGTGIEPDPIVGGTKDLSRELVNLFLLYGVGSRKELLIEYEAYRWNVSDDTEIKDIISGFVKNN